MTNLNNVQREELLKEMKELCSKYGFEITEKSVEEKTDIQKGKDNFFEQIENLPIAIERINNSNAILNIGEVVRTKKYYEITCGRRLGYYDGNFSRVESDKCFKEDFPNSTVISIKEGVTENKELFIEYTFKTCGFLKINLSTISENENNFYINRKQQQNVTKEKRKIKKIEKFFNEIL